VKDYIKDSKRYHALDQFGFRLQIRKPGNPDGILVDVDFFRDEWADVVDGVVMWGMRYYGNYTEAELEAYYHLLMHPKEVRLSYVFTLLDQVQADYSVYLGCDEIEEARSIYLADKIKNTIRCALDVHSERLRQENAARGDGARIGSQE
jgi:hypothetical protein